MSQPRAGLSPNLWLERLFRPLVIAVMFGCIALSLVGLVRLIFPAWNGTFLVVGCVLAALEAHYSFWLIRARALRGDDLLRFRAIEIAMFFPLLKLGSYLGESWTSVVADIQTWPNHLYHVFDLETLAAFVLAFLSWQASTQTARDFERLNDPPEYHRYYVSPMETLTGRFFRGGVALLIAAGLTRIGIAQLLNLRRPPVPGLVLNVLVYFLLGLVMLGQVRFATLRKRWQSQEIEVADELAGRWVRYSLAFIGLVALLAFVLPTGYTLGLLAMIGWILGAIAAVISFVAMLLLWLFTIPMTWLLSLLGPEPSASPPSLPPPQFSQPDPATSAPADWFQVLRSLVFWAVAVGMLVYVVRSYLRDRPELLETLLALGPIRMLLRLWAALWRWLDGWGPLVTQHIPRQWPQWLTRRMAMPEEPFRYLRLRGLSPRAQVLYYYLSILQRAGQQGLPRRAAQTPYEYKATLAHNLPGVQEEMELLTQAFVEARYSQHVVELDQVQRVRINWKQVKAALRSIKRTQEDR